MKIFRKGPDVVVTRDPREDVNRIKAERAVQDADVAGRRAGGKAPKSGKGKR